MIASRPLATLLRGGSCQQSIQLCSNSLQVVPSRALLRGGAFTGRLYAASLQRHPEVALEHGDEPQQIIIQDDFLQTADHLRGHFTSRFANPLDLNAERFVWDYWHVPDQYTLLRTPADQFFPEEAYQQLEDALLEYGEEHLGCRGMSPVWLSYYVDGCRQELHADSPHGPWAFVLSLTDWEHRGFTGGETTIFQPHMLNFWSSFDPDKGFEFKDMVHLVEPRFNRLTVFDGRYPHGVRPVEGTRDPLKARLVLHGWFTDPTPFFEGPVDEDVASDALDSVLEGFYEALEARELPAMFGALIVKLTVSGSSGMVTDMQCLTDMLMEVPSEQDYELRRRGSSVRKEIFELVRLHLRKLTFPEADGDSKVIMPFIFD
ncbi:g10177 [Coccomyxa viridis]|uniref:G10177 protein n=1 Tax=Coccomyxa viridis TaxID=1274662 RepID=A0ABP1GBR3_9CHLO